MLTKPASGQLTSSFENQLQCQRPRHQHTRYKSTIILNKKKAGPHGYRCCNEVEFIALAALGAKVGTKPKIITKDDLENTKKHGM